MRKIVQSYKHLFVHLAVFTGLLSVVSVVSATTSTPPNAVDLQVQETALGFEIPSLADILTFAIRAFFVIAGLAALFYMLLGALAWVTSGGDADAVKAAQQKIQAAVVGVLVIVAVLAIIWTLEQVIFQAKICFGLSCPVTLPALVTPKG